MNIQFRERFSCGWAIFFLLAATVLMFGDVLFPGGSRVLSHESTDTNLYFLHLRTFSFGELRHGNWALWNPHICGGLPHVGGFQAALFYPPHYLFHPFLPVEKAVNCEIAFHSFLLGLFMYLWASRKGLHPIAALLSALVLVWSGPAFLHIYAGHLSNLAAMAWIPLIFLALDGVADSTSPRWWLLGVFAVAMQIFAGHPQYVYYTAIVAFLYAAVRLFDCRYRRNLVSGLFAFYAAGALLAAVQLFTGVQAAGETVRATGQSSEFVSLFSLPPENLLTLIVPALFGDGQRFPYWGRWYLWETDLFFGVAALLFAVFGLAGVRKPARYRMILLVAIVLLFALGASTPFFHISTLLPGFTRFRGSAKFIVFAGIFLALGAGMGFDRFLLCRGKDRRMTQFASIATLFFLVCAGIAWYFAQTHPDVWAWSMRTIESSGQTFLLKPMSGNPSLVAGAGFNAVGSLLVSLVTCLALLIFLRLSRRSYGWIFAIFLLVVGEVFFFARGHRATFNAAGSRSPQLRAFIAAHPGSYRIFNPGVPNMSMSMGTFDIWGYEPCVLKRYAEFMAFTQESDPDQAGMALSFSRIPGLFSLLRLRYVFLPSPAGLRGMEREDIMPRALLLRDYRVIADRDGVFAAMKDPSFDPRRTVILEREPDPRPQAGRQETGVKVEQKTTDRLIVEANVSSPCVLLLTDPYSRHWKARGFVGGVKKEYPIIPADYFLQAIPLSEGVHTITIEYLPSGFVVGKWVSLIAWIIYAGLLGWYFARKRRGDVPISLP